VIGKIRIKNQKQNQGNFCFDSVSESRLTKLPESYESEDVLVTKFVNDTLELQPLSYMVKGQV